MAYDGSTIIRDQNNNPIPQQWDDENQEWKAYGEMSTKVQQSESIDVNKRKPIAFAGEIVEPYPNDYEGVVSTLGLPLFHEINNYDKRCAGVAINFEGDFIIGDENGDLTKYDFYGNELFSDNLTDEIRTAISDNEGNFYLGLSDGKTYKLDTNNNLTLIHDFSGVRIFCMNVDLEGNIYIGLFTSDRDNVYKYNSSLDEVWHTEISGKEIASITTDLNGNVYVGTRAFSKKIYKLDSNGTEVWDYSIGEDLTGEGANVEDLLAIGNRIFGICGNNIFEIDSDSNLIWHEHLVDEYLDKISFVNQTLITSGRDTNIYYLDLSGNLLHKLENIHHSRAIGLGTDNRGLMITASNQVYVTYAYLQVSGQRVINDA